MGGVFFSVFALETKSEKTRYVITYYRLENSRGTAMEYLESNGKYECEYERQAKNADGNVIHRTAICNLTLHLIEVHFFFIWTYKLHWTTRIATLFITGNVFHFRGIFFHCKCTLLIAHCTCIAPTSSLPEIPTRHLQCPPEVVLLHFIVIFFFFRRTVDRYSFKIAL